MILEREIGKTESKKGKLGRVRRGIKTSSMRNTNKMNINNQRKL